MAVATREMISLAGHLAETAQAVLCNARAGEFETKADGSPVTALDRAVEAALRTEIASARPEDGIIGEEYGSENADRDWVWILDPIDGTRQFAAGLPNFGTLIALCHRQIPVLGVIAHPWTGLVCIGITGLGTTINGTPVKATEAADPSDVIACLSDPDAIDAVTRAGYLRVQAASHWNVYDGGCLGYAALAEGRIGVALNGPNLEPFDIAALIPVVQGAGGVISDWSGNTLDASSEGAIVATGNPVLHERILELLSG